jgi:hypothetical protein
MLKVPKTFLAQYPDVFESVNGTSLVSHKKGFLGQTADARETYIFTPSFFFYQSKVFFVRV